MHNENLMREALQSALDAMNLHCFMYPHMDKGFMVEAREKAEQALSHVEEKPKNEHDSDDVLKRAPLLELNDENIQRDAARFEYLEKFTQCIKTPKGDLAWTIQLQRVLVGDTFGKAVDAAIEFEKKGEAK